MLFRKRQPSPSPPWLKWLVLGFLFIIIVTGVHKGTPEQPNPMHEALTKAATDLNPKKFFNFSEYKSKIFPGSDSSMRVKDIADGEGVPVVCGQEVSVAYDAFLTDNTPIKAKADKAHPLVYRLGEGKVVPALEQGVLGMKPEGKRSLFAQPSMAYGDKDFARPDVAANAAVRFEVELLGEKPILPDSDAAPYRIIPIQNGHGPLILCGMPAKIQLTLWSLAGKKLFSTHDEGQEPITFMPGKSEVFLGLEQGVVGMSQTASKRTLIVPPAFQNTMFGNAPTVDFPFPKEQTVLVDVESVP